MRHLKRDERLAINPKNRELGGVVMALEKQYTIVNGPGKFDLIYNSQYIFESVSFFFQKANIKQPRNAFLQDLCLKKKTLTRLKRLQNRLIRY